MSRELVKRLKAVIDQLESAVEDGNCEAVEEALDELRSLIEELEG